jgi:hypothetical protein
MMGVPAEVIDVPKCLGDRGQCDARLALLRSPLMGELTAFVELVRIESGEPDVPYFDPLDGGIEAECLFLLEAPGPKAVLSGFVSRNNPDETAKNWFELNLEAGIDRRRTIMWNIVPWYIGRDGGIRPATIADLELGLPYLHRLVSLLSALRVVALVGKKAGRARTSIQAWASRITIIELPHPSPVFLNRRPHHRDLVRQGLQHVREVLDGTEVVA